MPAQTALKAAEVNVGPASAGTAGLDAAGVFRSHPAVFRKGSRVSSVIAGAAQLHYQFPFSPLCRAYPLLLTTPNSFPDDTATKDSCLQDD